MEVVTDLIFSIDAQPRKEEYKKKKKENVGTSIHRLLNGATSECNKKGADKN